jgi:hypothetical protein
MFHDIYYTYVGGPDGLSPGDIEPIEIDAVRYRGPGAGRLRATTAHGPVVAMYKVPGLGRCACVISVGAPVSDVFDVCCAQPCAIAGLYTHLKGMF